MGCVVSYMIHSDWCIYIYIYHKWIQKNTHPAYKSLCASNQASSGADHGPSSETRWVFDPSDCVLVLDFHIEIPEWKVSVATPGKQATSICGKCKCILSQSNFCWFHIYLFLIPDHPSRMATKDQSITVLEPHQGNGFQDVLGLVHPPVEGRFLDLWAASIKSFMASPSDDWVHWAIWCLAMLCMDG